MVEQRTEEEKLVKAPIKVILGGKEYDVKPLVIRDSREWRKSVVEILSSLPAYLKTTSGTPDEFGAAMNALLVTMSDKVTDLFFGYAKDLNRDEIEATATDEELSVAFGQVVAVAFPLVNNLLETAQKLTKPSR